MDKTYKYYQFIVYLMLEKLKLFLQNPQIQFELKVAAIGMVVMTLYVIGTGNVHSIQDVVAGAHRR